MIKANKRCLLNRPVKPDSTLYIKTRDKRNKIDKCKSCRII
jgi:hypothetical protein